jgi:hypothetical protein
MRKTERGFTHLELVIAIQLVAIVAATALPNLVEKRKRANEAAAILSLRTITSAQQQFRERDSDGDGQFDYAASFEELIGVGLLDQGFAGGGPKSGYFFGESFGTPHPFAVWSVTANPIGGPVGIGDWSYCALEDGFFQAVLCPPGWMLKAVVVHGRNIGCVCTPGDHNLPDERSPGEPYPLFASLTAVTRLSELSGETALAQAKQRDYSESSVSGLLSLLDGDGNAALSLAEILRADLFEAVRSEARRGGDSSPPVGPDAGLDRVLRDYQNTLAGTLGLPMAGEGSLAEQSIGCMSGHPLPFLELLPVASESPPRK